MQCDGSMRTETGLWVVLSSEGVKGCRPGNSSYIVLLQLLPLCYVLLGFLPSCYILLQFFCHATHFFSSVSSKV